MSGYLQTLSDNIQINRDKCIFCGKCVDTCVLDNLRLKLAPCSHACPMGVNVQGYVQLVLRGEEDKARKLVREKLPFPETMCMVCHHPCETACERGKKDAPVNIRGLKRYLFDCEEGRLGEVPQLAPRSGKRIAIVGSGPAGIVAAYDLAIRGHDVVVFEKEDSAGGELAKGIPEFRLPVEIVRRELEILPRVGVKFVFNSTIGKDITLKELEDEYDAVILATGLGRGRELGVEGEQLDGVINGVDFLARMRQGKAQGFHGKAIVIGAGNVAMDTALSALRQGASDVTMVTLEQFGEMPAFAQETRQAVEEGVHFKCGWGVTRINGKNGCVVSLDLRKCVKVFDADGRFAPEFGDEVCTIEADYVLEAIGQIRDPEVLNNSGLELKSLDAVDRLTGQWCDKSLFVAGDFLTGSSSVIQAMASGRNAAESAHRLVSGEHMRYGRQYPGPVDTDFDIKPQGADVPRQEPVFHIMDGKGDQTVVEGCLGKEQARIEASRCHSCGVPYGKYKSCWFCLPCEVDCPEKAIYVKIPYLLR